MKNIIHSICILLIIMLIQSCNKTDPCPKGQENYYNLTDEEKSKIPYTGTDTLVFISDKGDTASLVGQGKRQSYKRTTTGGNPDCGAGSYVYENYERIDYLYIGTNSNLNEIKITIGIYYQTSSLGYLSVNNENFQTLSLTNSNFQDTIVYKSAETKVKILKKIEPLDINCLIYYSPEFGLVKIKKTNITWTKH